ncbi:MAG: tetratricopeptide repeat protein, partial [Candidatus Sungbacteria bacterium]|nr:tetratricopeptide repeat protein [Candidatus Sungbacteria bacterium]
MLTSMLSQERFMYAAKVILYIFAALLPVVFLPRPLGIDFGREMTFGMLIMLAFVLWVLSVLATGEIRWRHSPILYGAGLLAATFTASALLSPAPWVSVFFGDVAAERLSSVVAGLLLMLTAGNILRRREEGGTLLFIMIFSGALSAALTAFQLLADVSLLRAIGAVQDATANVVGTMNGLALIYTVLFAVTAGIVFSSAAAGWRAWIRWALGAAAFLFLMDLVLINFRTSWIAALGSSVILFGLFLVDGADGHFAGIQRLRMRHWAMACFSMVAIVMIMLQGTSTLGVVIPAEVSPSLNATLSITTELFKQGPMKVFFGSGPGTFGLLWAEYKDPSINQTIFWGTRFNQGQSWAATLLPTVGVLGAGAFAIFLLSLLITFLRMLFGAIGEVPARAAEVGLERIDPSSGTDSSMLARALFGGLTALLIGVFLYPVTLTFLLIFFLMIGVMIAVIVPVARTDRREASETVSEYSPALPEYIGEDAENQGGFWSVKDRVVRFNAPWSIFVSSLAAIFLVAFGVAVLWGGVKHIRAVLAQERGIAAANAGDIDGAIAHLARAYEIEPQDTHSMNILVQVRTEKVRRVLERAVSGENVQQEFQTVVSDAVRDAQRLTDMYPQDPNLWRVRAALYELVIPYIQGSERFATEAYQKAAEREPANPEIYVQWGRAGLAFADRIAFAANQAQGKDKEDLLKAYNENLTQIVQIFQRAIHVKQDFAPAHFLLAQTALRLGNTDAAIQSVENAKAAAPFDAGIAFQLGLLYYQKNNLDRARAEFERAVSINENYSNARYFLWLIYDRQ